MTSKDSDLICPKCSAPLKHIRTSKGMFWGCDRCNGRAITVELLRRIFTAESINPLWKHAISGEGISSRLCPDCRKSMIEVTLSDFQLSSIVGGLSSTPHARRVVKICAPVPRPRD